MSSSKTTKLPSGDDVDISEVTTAFESKNINDNVTEDMTETMTENVTENVTGKNFDSVSPVVKSPSLTVNRNKTPSNNIPLNCLDDEHDDPICNIGDTHNVFSDSLLSLSFNQDGGCLAVGTTSGFRIYNVYPFQETFRRTFDNTSSFRHENGKDANSKNTYEKDGNWNQKSPNGNNGSGNDAISSPTSSRTNGIGIVEMLFRCNLLALVGGGPSPRYPPNKVMIWDDHRGRCIGELSFRQRVLSVKLRRDRVAVALMDRVYVYNFSDLTLLDQIHTIANPLGLLSLSPDAGGLHIGASQSVGMVLACPSINRGGVRVELYGCRKTVLIDAHETSLAALSLSLSGTLLATASERGTLIRLFSTKDKNGTLLREFRRGVERANIFSIAFSMDNQWLATTSDRGTAHIFYLGEEKNTQLTNHTNAQLTRLLKSKRILWEGEGSYAQIRGIDDPVVCAFVPDKPMTIAIVGKTDGSILLADFSKGSGEAERVAYHRFIKSTNGNTKNNIKQNQNKEGSGLGSGINLDFREEDVVFGDEDDFDGFVTVEKAGES